MKKILIIDDEPKNIFALVAVLKSRKYECMTASSAAEGLSLLRNDTGIAIVLMDMMMPDMDGYEALIQLREDPQLKVLPVIAVTAQAMVGDKEKCLSAGANDYVSKPINIDLLVSKIENYL